MIKVVHCKKEDYDVYIGRGKCPKTGKEGKWGNPFIIGKDGTRADVIRLYRKYVVKQKHLMDSLHELKNKTLGCFCAPLPCHGDVLKELVEEARK